MWTALLHICIMPYWATLILILAQRLRNSTNSTRIPVRYASLPRRDYGFSPSNILSKAFVMLALKGNSIPYQCLARSCLSPAAVTSLVFVKRMIYPKKILSLLIIMHTRIGPNIWAVWFNPKQPLVFLASTAFTPKPCYLLAHHTIKQANSADWLILHQLNFFKQRRG